MYDVAIIGAGAVGTAIARLLSHHKCSVELFEKENDVAMGDTLKLIPRLIGRLCYKGLKQFDQLNKELNFGFDKNGSLVIAFEEDQLPKLKALYENGLANGLDDLEIIDHNAIMALEPNINPDVKYALYCKGAGICCPYSYAIALAENAIANGVELHLNAPIVNIEKK